MMQPQTAAVSAPIMIKLFVTFADAKLGVGL